MALKRPVSPFLSIYKLQTGSFFSIFSRISGIVLLFFFLLAGLFNLLFRSSLSFSYFYSFFYVVVAGSHSFFFSFLFLLLLFSFYYHLLVGLRYFFLSANSTYFASFSGEDPFLRAGVQMSRLIAFLTSFLTVITFVLS